MGKLNDRKAGSSTTSVTPNDSIPSALILISNFMPSAVRYVCEGSRARKNLGDKWFSVW
jgi:hypothetical protein